MIDEGHGPGMLGTNVLVITRRAGFTGDALSSEMFARSRMPRDEPAQTPRMTALARSALTSFLCVPCILWSP